MAKFQGNFGEGGFRRILSNLLSNVPKSCLVTFGCQRHHGAYFTCFGTASGRRLYESVYLRINEFTILCAAI